MPAIVRAFFMPIRPELIRKVIVMKYYSLLIKENGKWSPEFGDFDKETVEYERGDILEYSGHAARDLKIITTNGTQSAIDSKVAALNEKEEEKEMERFHDSNEDAACDLYLESRYPMDM